ncbi:hypothetical protein Y1Q_0011593 [Alligator mississippiensis]|uniref:Uncharacterized protein n=1 Tax=Alligator mississippiensis TaxID=8496 RepID=A0A151M0D6_ALLMI|nr:hypothetical protein Y1Q_0011593 [Alligator mississippiensis]
MLLLLIRLCPAGSSWLQSREAPRIPVLRERQKQRIQILRNHGDWEASSKSWKGQTPEEFNKKATALTWIRELER